MNEIKEPFIQRGKFEVRDNVVGIDSILVLDYVGSYNRIEWNDIRVSLERIREMIDEYTFLDVDCEDRVITVFCRDTQIDHARQYLADLSANKWHLPEYDDFDNNIDQENKFKCGTDFWWDISNHFMFWIKNDEIEPNFKTIISTNSAFKIHTQR